jgi:hypothetical protein
VLLGFGSPAGGLIGLRISFLLKNKLHLKAHEMAIFGLIDKGDRRHARPAARHHARAAVGNRHSNALNAASSAVF